MSTGQRIIKSLAVAFGLFLTFTIFFSIVGGLYAFTSMFSKDNVIEENTSILLNQANVALLAAAVANGTPALLQGVNVNMVN